MVAEVASGGRCSECSKGGAGLQQAHAKAFKGGTLVREAMEFKVVKVSGAGLLGGPPRGNGQQDIKGERTERVGEQTGKERFQEKQSVQKKKAAACQLSMRISLETC